MAPRGSQRGSVHPYCPPSDCGWSREGFLGNATLLGGGVSWGRGGEKQLAGWMTAWGSWLVIYGYFFESPSGPLR